MPNNEGEPRNEGEGEGEVNVEVEVKEHEDVDIESEVEMREVEPDLRESEGERKMNIVKVSSNMGIDPKLVDPKTYVAFVTDGSRAKRRLRLENNIMIASNECAKLKQLSAFF
ncbi:hypothetical protein K2173_012614 [Erythroxylum novogranatense]|uniref:Uncharacterized protein n=1 Tax=Erythroxylum novogranatense TaxID=1862640 RepID=A0AAV8S763_9ROSI|nr:hypothetical protein K2173_012614 [Erythroxylum novogranatense]